MPRGLIDVDSIGPFHISIDSEAMHGPQFIDQIVVVIPAKIIGRNGVDQCSPFVFLKHEPCVLENRGVGRMVIVEVGKYHGLHIFRPDPRTR